MNASNYKLILLVSFW